jgi:hypothetical protein
MLRKYLLIIFLFVICFASSLFSQKYGKDNTFGYTWLNSDTVAGPTYNWIDMKSKGTLVNGLLDDNTVGPFNLGFNFQYYMSNCNKIWIGSNGYISFQNGITLNAPFSTIPTIDSSNANFAAGMLSDLTFTHDSTVWDNIILDSVVKVFPISGTTAWFWTNYSDSAIVQFDSVPFWDTIPKGYHIGRNTFQIILTSKDSSILYQ